MSTMLRVIKHCKLRLLSPLYAQCVYFFEKEKGKRNHQKAIKKSQIKNSLHLKFGVGLSSNYVLRTEIDNKLQI